MAENFDLGGSVSASDLDDIRISLDAINLSADRMSRSLSRAFASAIVSGKNFEETLRSIALNLSKLALSAGLQPLLQGATSLVGGAFSSLIGGGGSISIAPFADGGIVARPTFFGSGGGVGLMGERGAEAILPLARGPDGRLGIASRATVERAPVNITIATPDPVSFRHSQIEIASTLARAVMRAHRAL